ncbi:hypothetical protein AYO21_06755 [Fonsecaea monophora]|uniref:Uncharacterized protein n=1 Tax=Fonsecaea monophora TaxID=254056 RepID=A0A177F3Z6_9EURO|nr:hypothetical protein AYO21_06755 [Fonsecaea monophora]OAG39035.1 hypothetical protein AYO21_06755 [Fonsecaea monophora]
MDERPESRDKANEHIEQFRRKRGIEDAGEQNISTTNQQDLEASISILAEGLYEKSTHFLLELIQNADDCSYTTPTPRMLINYWNGRLRLDYNEVGFTRRDVEALCRVGRSTKSSSGSQIGEKGIGFKSVFKIADVVSIASGCYSFKFDRTKTNLGMITPECDTFPVEPLPGFTSVLLELRGRRGQTKLVDETELVDEMRSMDPRCLMFLRNLKEIHIAASPLDKPKWETTLGRSDDQARQATTLSYGDKSMTYLVRRHIVTPLPYEQKRRGRDESAILLAFPYIDAQETKLEPQQVYAFLPIRDYGFKFLIHADFLLIANRGDIDSSSQWNTALREAMLAAFLEDIQYFQGTAFRYTWPRYLPDYSYRFDFFRNFRTRLAKELPEKPILESEDGQLRSPNTVRYVPKHFRDGSNIPLILIDATKSKYLSHKYSESDSKRLMDIGVTTLSDKEFLDDLGVFLRDHKALMPESWHSSIARALLPLIPSFELEISELYLIPLTNGRRVAASSGNIFFPRPNPDYFIPPGIEVFELHRDIAKNPDCKRLYKNLGVKQFSNPVVQKLILKKHSNNLPELNPPPSELLSQARFLFRSGWEKPIDDVQFWVVKTNGALCRSHEIYLDTDEQFSASRYLERDTQLFPFLHSCYDKDVASEELPLWRTWLHTQLGLWKIPRLVKISGNTIDPELSEDFRYILKRRSSRQILMLLKENWSVYSRYIFESGPTGLRSQLASVSVHCRDGSRHPLKATSTGYFIPEDCCSEYSVLPPILDIPNPKDPRWTFLKVFGVTVNGDLNTYLSILGHIQGRKASVRFVRWLYDRIQGQCEDNPALVRDEFLQKNLIYIPSSSPSDLPNWVTLNRCVWSGPKCLTQFYKLSEIHPDHRILFVKHLKVKNARLETLVLESKAITPSTHLSHIASVFKELNEIMPDPISMEDTKTLQSLLTLNIFPLDEGGDSNKGFDELSSATAGSQWYIADRPHLRQCFHGIVSLLAFTVKDVHAIKRLMAILGLECRLLSKVAKQRHKIDGGKARGKEIDMLFQEKARFFERLMPESVPNKQQTLDQLKKVKIWHADRILAGWDIETTNLTSDFTRQESPFRDDGLQALLMPQGGTDPLRIYLRDDSSLSCPQLELAEQLAAFCGIPECAALILFILGQSSSLIIEATLDRRGIPKTRDKKLRQDEAAPSPATQDGSNEEEDATTKQSSATAEEPQAPGSRRTIQETWIGPDEEQQEYEEPTLKRIIDDEAQIDINHLTSQSQSEGLLDSNSTDNQTFNKQQTRRKSPNRASSNNEQIISEKSSSSRPNYVPLDDAPRIREYIRGQGEPSRRKRIAMASADSHGIETLERPRIVGHPNCIYVKDCRELPRENFSDQAPDGKVLPGRAQISRSGECTVFLALEPAYKIDTYTKFLGELYVSQLFEKYLGGRYDPDSQWTSPYRGEAGYTSLRAETQSTATFTFSDGAAMTEFLIHSGSGWRRNGDYPGYHILVKTTNGGQESLFTMSAEEMEMIRRHRLSPGGKHQSQVIILVRVFDMQSTASASFFIDPWRLYTAGGLQIRPQNDFYIANTPVASPDLLFKHFEMELFTPSIRNSVHFLTSYIRDSGELWARRMLQHDERKYRYKPLESQSLMRLLRLHPGRGREELRGELICVSLEHYKRKYPFTALSYVWGNSLKPYVLGIGDYALRITASLYFALKRVREEKQSILIWADAICIDQANDVEKGHQVRLMSKIYKSALRVCAWLGNEGDQSNSAINWLCKIRKASESSKQAATVRLPSADNPVWDIIKKFFERDWFHRVWIVQELVLAPHIILLCGNRTFEWDDLYVPATLCSRQAEKSTAALMTSVSKTMAPVLSLGGLRRAYRSQLANSTAQRELLTLFKDFEHTRSSRRRDKLFAFLGLACDVDDPSFDPDYAAPLETVVCKYAAAFVRHGKGMELLYHAGASGLEDDARFPSWVPNWVTTAYPKTITTWTSKSGIFSACSHEKDSIRISPRNGSILTATAYEIDLIAKVGQISFTAGDRTRWLKEVFSYIEPISTYPTEDNPKDLVWKVLVGDALGPPSGSWNVVDFRASCEAFAEYLQMDADPGDWNVEAAKMRAVAKLKQFLFRPQELRKLMWPLVHTAEEFAQRFVDAKVCITEHGYVGIVPGAARVGSRVILLAGSAVPFIMDEIKGNKRNPPCYRHLGECYIHGIMHGAANQRSGLFRKPLRDIILC